MDDYNDEPLNLFIKQGKTYKRILQFYDGADQKLDFSDCTARMQARLTIDSASTVLDMTTENGKIAIEGGDIILQLTALQTAALTFDKAYYDFEIIRGAEVIEECSYRGSITLIKEVTR
jgi:hypothetical protein